jgi:hypothetical protein
MVINVTKNSLAITASVALVLISIVLAATTYAAISTTKNVSSSGTVIVSPNLTVFSDSACTDPIAVIDWGSVSPGGSTTKTIYIKNTGTGTSISLDMATNNWNPTDSSNYMTITWNPTKTTILPNETTAATITLSVSPSVIGITNFSVQISLTGTSV